MTLSAHDQFYLDTLKGWHASGGQVFIGGTAVGALHISDTQSQFGRNTHHTLSPELKQAILVDLEGTDTQLTLAQTQRMLGSLDRFAPGAYRSQIARQDRLDANLDQANDPDEDDGFTPTLS